jgi:hypothetical protein
VTDLFAVLGLARSAWLDAEEIKERHHALMASDSAASATLLNEARRTLQNPTLRIRHFLALEFPDFAPASRPHQDWEFFLKVGQTTRLASELAAKKSSLSIPLARAALQNEILAKNETLLLLKAEIETRLAACEERLKISAGPELLTALAEEFAFLQKNETSVREALLALDQGLA